MKKLKKQTNYEGLAIYTALFLIIAGSITWAIVWPILKGLAVLKWLFS